MPNPKEYGFQEENAEEVIHHFMKTGWPKPINRLRLVYETYNQSIEELYFWAKDELKEEEGYTHFDKITDVFAASEHSAFFGVAQQRLGLQQDKVSQFLGTVGKMIKELFQLVRELRIIDERLILYKKSYAGDKPAEISLKGYWIDLVEGGAKNPASVYGMSRELGFATLPDLFFDAPPMNSDNVGNYVNKLLFNKKVKEVLMRKLKLFLIWKESTLKEMDTRKTFTVKYLRQHYDIIRMYLDWVKPYLRNVRRLSMDEKKMDTAQIISSFEGSMIEIEVIAKRDFGSGVFGCLNLHFDYRSRPEMKFVQEGYQRGPVHVGRTTMTIRSYVWTAEELESYKKMKTKEDFELLGSIDSSVQAAYISLGEDLEKYLKEAGEKFTPEFEKSLKIPKETVFSPFLSTIKGAGELFGAFTPAKKENITCKSCKKTNPPGTVHCSQCGRSLRKLSRKEAFDIKDKKGKAESFTKKSTYSLVKRIKAAHGWVY